MKSLRPVPKVIISILNWNKSSDTLACIDSILQLDKHAASFEVTVIDNGSSDTEWETLLAGTAGKSIQVLREAKNIGFAAGHNIVMRRALEQKVDFIWLVNNDTLVRPDTLSKLLDVFASDPVCGAVAPVSVATHDENVMDFAGSIHDWKNLTQARPQTVAEVALLEKKFPLDMWVSGAAMLIRTRALKEVGLLDERYFAYYEDTDFGARLARHGWTSRMAFDATIRHECYDGVVTNRPPYFFYLLQRNFFLFWIKNTPASYRKLLWLRLLDHSFFQANRLKYLDLGKKEEAVLLGIHDAIFRKFGAPKLNKKVPWSMRFLQSIFWLQHRGVLERLIPKNQ